MSRTQSQSSFQMHYSEKTKCKKTAESQMQTTAHSCIFHLPNGRADNPTGENDSRLDNFPANLAKAKQRNTLRSTRMMNCARETPIPCCSSNREANWPPACKLLQLLVVYFNLGYTLKCSQMRLDGASDASL